MAKYQVPEGTVPLPVEQKVAGVSSLSSKATREPAFTHKRRIAESQPAVRNDQVVQGMKFNEERMNLVQLNVSHVNLCDSLSIIVCTILMC